MRCRPCGVVPAGGCRLLKATWFTFCGNFGHGGTPDTHSALKECPPGTRCPGGASDPVHGASPSKPAGSLRKRTSPWVDKRFSVIQEEVEGSRENIIE